MKSKPCTLGQRCEKIEQGNVFQHHKDRFTICGDGDLMVVRQLLGPPRKAWGLIDGLQPPPSSQNARLDQGPVHLLAEWSNCQSKACHVPTGEVASFEKDLDHPSPLGSLVQARAALGSLVQARAALGSLVQARADLGSLV